MIMVIFFVKEGNSIRKVYEYSEFNRIVIIKVKEVFD